MYSLAWFSLLFCTILGADYSKKSKCYKDVKIATHKKYLNDIKKRVMSLLNILLTLFHLAFNSLKYIIIPFSFKLYDICLSILTFIIY